MKTLYFLQIVTFVVPFLRVADHFNYSTKTPTTI